MEGSNRSYSLWSILTTSEGSGTQFGSKGPSRTLMRRVLHAIGGILGGKKSVGPNLVMVLFQRRAKLKRQFHFLSAFRA